jgi:hypothetical protein
MDVTGRDKVQREGPLPAPQANDGIAFAGRGHAGQIVVKDRYRSDEASHDILSQPVPAMQRYGCCKRFRPRRWR